MKRLLILAVLCSTASTFGGDLNLALRGGEVGSNAFTTSETAEVFEFSTGWQLVRDRQLEVILGGERKVCR